MMPLAFVLKRRGGEAAATQPDRCLGAARAGPLLMPKGGTSVGWVGADAEAAVATHKTRNVFEASRQARQGVTFSITVYVKIRVSV
jgi:hypothetical protein